MAGSPPSVSKRRFGQLIVAVSALAYLAFVGISAATAPPLTATGLDGAGTATPGPGSPTGTDASASSVSRATLVGHQGPFTGRQGHATLYAADGSVEWRSPEVWAHFDVTPLDDGRVLAAFLEKGYEECGPYDPPCSRTGFRVIDPSPTPSVEREWTMPVRSHVNSEVHDVEPLPSGELLVVDMEYERLLTVDEDDEVTWQWNASDYYTDGPEDPTQEDWLHMNDVDRIGQDRYLVSVRNANQLLIVERGEGVVDVINEDGDESVMSEQHNPMWLGEGRVLVADSDNDRVVELRETDGEWRVAWQLRSAGGVPFHWPRDVDLLPYGNLLITDSLNDRVVEVTRTGELVWSIETGPVPYEADRLEDGEYFAPPDELGGNGSEGSANGTDGPATGTAAAPSTGTDGTASAPPNDRGRADIPVVSMVYSSLRGSTPMPYWVTEWHLLGLVVVLVLQGVGGWLWYSAPAPE